MKMKKLLTLLVLGASSFGVSAQTSPYMTKSFKASQIRNLDVKTSGGSITVLGRDNAEAVVEVYVKSSNGSKLSASEIDDRLEDYTLEVRQEGNTLVCFAKNNSRGWTWKNGLSISFKVYSPEQINTELNTSGGGIKMANLEGDLKFTTSGGGLDLIGLRGNVRGRTSGGGIKIKDSEDNIDLTTSGGGIEALNVAGTVRLTTSGGGISLGNMYGSIRATTSGGSVRVDGVEGELFTSTSGGSISLDAIRGSVKANTSGGGIHADITEVGDFLVLHSSGGNIDVDMPFNKGMDLDIKGNRVSIKEYKNFNGSFDKDRVSGTVNGGGVEVKISTSSGNVYIN